MGRVVVGGGITGPDFRNQAQKTAASIDSDHPGIKGVWAVWDDPAESVVEAVRTAGRRDVLVVTVDYGESIATLLARG
jgi:ribose transport system substrate-binding protein